jgi:hypothetical protein
MGIAFGMKRLKKSKTFSAAAVFLFPYTLAVGFFLFTWFYFGREPLLSAQDDLNLLNPATFGEGSFFFNLWKYYVEASARLGEFGAFIAWSRIGGSLYQGDIYHYPWWFFKCLACFTYVVAGLQFSRVACRLARPSDRYQWSVIAFAGWALLGANALVPRTLLEIGTLLPAYALAMALYSCVALTFTREKPVPPYVFALLAPVYFFCIVAHEEVFLLSSFLSFAWLFFKVLTSDAAPKKIPRFLVGLVAVHALGACVFAFSPGHQSKLAIAGGMSFSVKRWLTQFTLSFSDLFPFPAWVSKLGFLLALGWAAFALISVWEAQGRSFKKALKTPQGARLFWAVAFFGRAPLRARLA